MADAKRAAFSCEDAALCDCQQGTSLWSKFWLWRSWCASRCRQLHVVGIAAASFAPRAARGVARSARLREAGVRIGAGRTGGPNQVHCAGALRARWGSSGQARAVRWPRQKDMGVSGSNGLGASGLRPAAVLALFGIRPQDADESAAIKIGRRVRGFRGAPRRAALETGPSLGLSRAPQRQGTSEDASAWPINARGR